MDDENYQKYKLAGSIAAEARDFGKDLIKPGVSYLEVVTKVEEKIKSNDAGIAFPVNIAVNNLAAHYSPTHDDKLTFKSGDIVKLDVGTHIDGYIADTAVTIELETHNFDDMIKASSEGLDVAISMMKPDVDLSELGKSVKEKINSYGFNPIDNLTGHSLRRFVLHAGMSIPSVADVLNKRSPQVDDVVAIEPFATDGVGHVITGIGSNIYLCNQNMNIRLIRDKRAKLLFNKLQQRFKTLPFAERWAHDLFENNNIVLRKLSFLGLIKHYPQLVEAKKGIVTQKEHTVIITEEGCEVTT